MPNLLPRVRVFGKAGVTALLVAGLLYLAIFQRHTLPRTLHTWPSTSTRHPLLLDDDIAWQDFAYCTYATSAGDLCNSVMLLAGLHAVHARPDLLLLHSDEWDVADQASDTGRLLARARDVYGAKLQPITILRADAVSDPTWAAGFTKWLAFNQTQYARVLTLDSDGTVLRALDELFLLPRTAVGLPRAYWLNDSLSAQLALVAPSAAAFARVQEQIALRGENDFDMEIINALYGDSCMVMPHRPYNLLTGEFRSEDHVRYLGDRDEVWDPEKIMAEAKYVHFSDWPLPKPWMPHNQAMLRELWPKCEGNLEGEADDCSDRKIWMWLYEDFRERREAVCGPAFMDWQLAGG